MTMLASSDFEKYVAQQTAKNQPVVFDQMIFCNISGLTADNLQNYLTMPTEIVHRVDISRAGYIDENKVVYSAVLGSNVGDFEFNYIGLINKSENILAVACFTDTIKKRKNKGKTYGNSMTRNIILHFSGAKALTQINVAAESWQVDFTNEFVTINNKFEYIASPEGFNAIGQCESIEQLRTIEPTEDNQRILVRGYYAGSNVGGGVFYANLGDKTTTDNGGTVIVTVGGIRWKRVYNALNLHDFGYETTRNNGLQAVNNAEQARVDDYVDCCGLTIDLGSKYPVCKYKNGKFLINGVTVNAQYNQPRTGIGRFISGSGAAENLKSSEWTGNDVTAIGEGAMAAMEKCVSAIAIGKRAQGASRISRDNIAIGGDALYQVQAETEWYSQDKKAGTRNIAIGGTAGRGITTGYGNVAVGRGAGQNLNSGALNVALGAGAIGGSVPIGFSGDIEHHFPSKIKTSVAIGAAALNQYVADAECVAVGGYAAEKMKKGLYNTAIGFGTLRNLEADIAPNGGEVLWTGEETGTYSQANSTITLIFNDVHGAEVGYTIGVRLLDGEIKTLMSDVVPATVLTKSGNTLTVSSPKSLSASGQAALCYVYSTNTVNLNTNQNTAIGFAALNSATRANYSTAIGTSALKRGDNISGSVAIGASTFEYGSHTNSVGIGIGAGKQANTSNAVIIGGNTLNKATSVTNSIFIGPGINPTSDEISNKLAISGITGDLANARYGINVPVDEQPLANLHIRPKSGKGSGRTSSTDGVLVEHTNVATVKIDGGTGADIDWHNGEALKFSIRYRAAQDNTIFYVGTSPSWIYSNDHVMYPAVSRRNVIGRDGNLVKEMYLAMPDLSESGDKVITAKWFRGQFTQSIAENGWSKLPNGLIMQWGKVTGIAQGDGIKGTVSLPLHATILNVSIGILSAVDKDPFILISSVRDGQFDFTKGNAYGSNSDDVEFYWQALTYVR